MTTVAASPSINTTQQPATAIVGSSIADKATVTGGYNPTGTVTFNLYSNPTGTGTPLFTDTETLVGGVATSAGYTATATGTDYWVATYNGDTNNVSVTSGKADEPVTISPASPSIITTPASRPATWSAAPFRKIRRYQRRLHAHWDDHLQVDGPRPHGGGLGEFHGHQWRELL